MAKELPRLRGECLPVACCEATAKEYGRVRSTLAECRDLHMEKYGGDAEGRRLGTTQELYWTTCCVLMTALLGLLEIQFDGDPAGLRKALSRVRPLNARFAYALGYYGALSTSCQYGWHMCDTPLGLFCFLFLEETTRGVGAEPPGMLGDSGGGEARWSRFYAEYAMYS
jgi:hypothetical protein